MIPYVAPTYNRGDLNVLCTRTDKILDPDLCRQICDLYFASFEGSEVECAQNQVCFTKSSMTEALGDSDYIKYLLWSDDDVVIGFSLLSSNLDKAARIAYQNPFFWERQFEEKKGLIFYFPGLFIEKAHRHSNAFATLVGPMFEHIDEVAGVAAFDFSKRKNPNLAEMLKALCDRRHASGTSKTSRVTLVIGDEQVYAALSLD